MNVLCNTSSNSGMQRWTDSAGWRKQPIGQGGVSRREGWKLRYTLSTFMTHELISMLFSHVLVCLFTDLKCVSLPKGVIRDSLWLFEITPRFKQEKVLGIICIYASFHLVFVILNKIKYLYMIFFALYFGDNSHDNSHDIHMTMCHMSTMDHRLEIFHYIQLIMDINLT